MNCFIESVASLWIHSLRVFGFRMSNVDLISDAKEQLRSTIEIVNQQTKTLRMELDDIKVNIKSRPKGTPATAMRKLLLQARKKRLEIDSLMNKSLIMESQLDALENNEVNKTVLHTLQTSAQALRDMGLQNDLLRADNVISELEEGLNQVNDINSTVSTGVCQLDLNLSEEDLNEELNLLFSDQPEPDGLGASVKITSFHGPPQKNNMASVQLKQPEDGGAPVSEKPAAIGIQVTGEEAIAA